MFNQSPINLLVLHWLHDFPKLNNLFGISTATASQHTTSLLPNLYKMLQNLSQILFPPTIKPHKFKSVTG
jgi:hypothetical protein